MSVSLNSSSIVTSSGALTLEKGSKSIIVKNNQRIYTDKYITSGSYVFKRNTVIPVVYFATNVKSFSIDYTTGTVTPTSVKPNFPAYFNKLSPILSDTSVKKSWNVGCCISNLSPSSNKGTTEASTWLTSHTISSSLYDKSNAAPTVRANQESLPNSSNTYVSCSVSGNKINVSLTQSNNALIVISVKLS